MQEEKKNRVEMDIQVAPGFEDLKQRIMEMEHKEYFWRELTNVEWVSVLANKMTIHNAPIVVRVVATGECWVGMHVHRAEQAVGAAVSRETEGGILVLPADEFNIVAVHGEQVPVSGTYTGFNVV